MEKLMKKKLQIIKIKCAKHWYTSSKDLAKYGPCPYPHYRKETKKIPF